MKVYRSRGVKLNSESKSVIYKSCRRARSEVWDHYENMLWSRRTRLVRRIYMWILHIATQTILVMIEARKQISYRNGYNSSVKIWAGQLTHCTTSVNFFCARWKRAKLMGDNRRCTNIRRSWPCKGPAESERFRTRPFSYRRSESQDVCQTGWLNDSPNTCANHSHSLLFLKQFKRTFLRIDRIKIFKNVFFVYGPVSLFPMYFCTSLTPNTYKNACWFSKSCYS